MFSKITAAIYALVNAIHVLARSNYAMTAATDHLTASANKIVDTMEKLLAANAAASDALRAANTSNDPAIEAVAKLLDDESAKASASLPPPAAPPATTPAA